MIRCFRLCSLAFVYGDYCSRQGGFSSKGLEVAGYILNFRVRRLVLWDLCAGGWRCTRWSGFVWSFEEGMEFQISCTFEMRRLAIRLHHGLVRVLHLYDGWFEGIELAWYSNSYQGVGFGGLGLKVGLDTLAGRISFVLVRLQMTYLCAIRVGTLRCGS